MNVLRLVSSLCLWPGLIATLLYFAKMVREIAQAPAFPWVGGALFLGGITVSGFAFCLLPRPRGFYVLGHELTHALAIWSCGGKVHSLQASAKGGKVLSDRVSPWISLAPYLLPFYPLVAGVLWLATCHLWPELQNYSLLLLAPWGALWGYHYAFTLSLIPTRQPDFLIYGRFFSITVILLGNTLLIGGLIWATFRPAPWTQTLLQLGTEWVRSYFFIASSISGLVLRCLPPSA